MNKPWFKFNPMEWLSGSVQLLKDDEKGTYIDLLALIWKEGGEIENNAKLHRRLKLDDATACNRIKLYCSWELLQCNGILLSSKFLTKQLDEIKELSEKYKKNAQNRWGNNATACNGTHKEKDKEEDKEKEKEKDARDAEVSPAGSFFLHKEFFNLWVLKLSNSPDKRPTKLQQDACRDFLQDIPANITTEMLIEKFQFQLKNGTFKTVPDLVESLQKHSIPQPQRLPAPPKPERKLTEDEKKLLAEYEIPGGEK